MKHGVYNMEKMKNKVKYLTVDLFGNESVIVEDAKPKSQTSFTDYEGFIEKFEIKKTTDDCYTPKDVYDAVLKYVSNSFDLSDKVVIRPFYPSGDYQSIDYPDNAVVIDNPPFSIISEICRFYIANGVKYFIFAPHLTNFGSDIDHTHIIASVDIIYENGANVKTSFLSNLYEREKIIGAPQLKKDIEAANNKKTVSLPKYIYPDEVMTVSKVAYLVDNGIDLVVYKQEVSHTRQLAAQKTHRKGIFGSGFLIGRRAAEQARQAAEQARQAAEQADKERAITWELSDAEIEIIKSLG